VRAVVHDRYGAPEVLGIEELPRPVPKDDEVLVRVHATTVNRTDCHVRAANPFIWRLLGAGFRRPKQRLSGSDFAGDVVEIGPTVTQFAIGDHVFGTSGFRFGAHADYICVRETARIAHMPAGMSFEEAAAVPDGALAALTSLKRAALRQGQKVVVYGASGAMGTAAVQLAKHFGAEVTAVCNTKNVELVRSLGADRVVDYTREDFTKSGETYDIVLDSVQKHSFWRSRRVLNPGGLYVATDLGFLWHVPLVALACRWIGDRKLVFPLGRSTKDDLLLVKDLVESGKYRAVIDRAYPLEDVVDASEYVETGQKIGNVVLRLTDAASERQTASGHAEAVV
jgi:NADPH:quinone reductase-like Zn-dependent oxidoreductase